METLESHFGVGEAKTLSDPTLEDWAAITAEMIFDTTDLKDDKADEAANLQCFIVASLESTYERALVDEQRALLRNKSTHGFQILPTVLDAVKDIQTIVARSPWDELVNSDDWIAVAVQTIGNHLATILHIERLQYADAHPDIVNS